MTTGRRSPDVARVIALLVAAVVIASGGAAAIALRSPGAAPPRTDGDAGRAAGPVDAPTLPPRPPVPDGPLAPDLEAELDALTGDLVFLAHGDLQAVGSSGDVRAGWVLVDLLRFFQGGDQGEALEEALRGLTGQPPGDDVAWVGYSDLLLAWDVPAPPGYLDWKRSIHLAYEPDWAPFFDRAADLDWREVSWGGVPRDGIAALTDPAVVVAEGAWLDDDDVVFGVVVRGEARAYPKRVMDVHELVNDTLGGTRIALPYCTLCGAAIAYVTEGIPTVEVPLELRTSGLLQRSNKLMYDVQTESLFDQFRGVAVVGPMWREGVALRRLPVVTTTWGEWRGAHPDTTVLDLPGDGDHRLGIPDPYDGNFLADRDAEGPMFPVGPRDPRLPAQEVVLGVVSDRGVAVAFPVADARAALGRGESVEAGGVQVRLEAGGLTAEVAAHRVPLPAHEAYWFAWSQFRTDTLLWQPDD